MFASRCKNIVRFSSAALLALLSAPAFAADGTGSFQVSMDTVWLVTAAALVFFMQAGFALLEGGMVRSKNTVNVIMKNYVDACVGSIVFWLVGYGLMFGVNATGWLGTDHFLLGNAEHMDYSLLLFQTMFAATCVTIASGAMAERTRYESYLVGAIGITAVIYPVYGSWAWGSLYTGSGWLKQMGFIDFAGSTVVHSIGGWVALAGIIVLGPRLGRFDADGKARPIPGHNLTLVALGGFILWLGWFGFNGGSTAAAVPSIGLINLNTHLAAASGAVGAMTTMWISRRPVLMTTTVNGSIGGLVAITAGCATMEPMYAVITGLVAGFVLVGGDGFLNWLRLDDVVGAVPVHAFCGAWGTLAAGLFKTGDLFNPTQVLVQFIGVAAGFLWAFPLALLMYFLIHKTMGLRAGTLDEQRGLDFTEHSEVGYPEFQTAMTHQK
ncbi:MAG TPA: ammonium transporter [Gammaproteobacteria bacterium]|nr:ammonium transporter [Gammaproteobacteria bacterium]